MRSLSVKYWFVGVLALVMFLSGCSSTTEPDFLMPVRVSSALDYFNASQTKVDRVVMTVSADDLGSKSQEVELINGKVELELEIKPGRDRTIRLDAYDADDLLLYSGQETVDVGLGEELTIEIKMEPQVLMIKVDPVYQRVDPNSGLVNSFQIYVYNVEDLFGVSFRINYDSSIIAPYDIEYHDFLGDDLLTLSKFEKNHVAVGMTNKRGSAQVDGSGLLATIFFDPIVEGETVLEIDTLIVGLKKASGFNIPNFTDLVFENSYVVVSGSPGGK